MQKSRILWLLFGSISLSAAGAAPTTRPAPATTRPATRPAAVAPDYAGMAAQCLAQTVRRGREPQLVSAASDALSVLGNKAVPALAKLQSDPDPIVRARVVEIAAAMSDRAAAVPLFVSAMKDPQAPTRDSALAHLRFANIGEATAVCAAADALHDPDAQVRQTALEYLTNLGENAAPAAPKLAASIDSGAIRILAGIGPRAESAVPALLTFYQDASRAKEDRVDAIIAVSRILGRTAPATQPAK